eukprot:2774841-Pyramimonas_sp.AAC.1
MQHVRVPWVPSSREATTLKTLPSKSSLSQLHRLTLRLRPEVLRNFALNQRVRSRAHGNTAPTSW